MPRYLLFCLIALLASCSAVKKVEHNPASTQSVVDFWLTSHIFKNDTVIIPGGRDTITQTILDSSINLHDTVSGWQGDTVHTCPPTYVITRTHTITNTIHDTTIQRIIDHQFDTLAKSNAIILANAQAATSLMAQKKAKWEILFFGLLVLAVVVALWKLLK